MSPTKFTLATLALAVLSVTLPTPARAGDVDLVAAAQSRATRIAELQSQAPATPDAQRQLDSLRNQDPWHPTDGPPALTLPPSDSPAFHPFTFAVLSDLHLSERQGPQRLTNALSLLSERHDIAFALVLGDIVWDHDPEQLKSLLATAHIPVHLVYGNNDWKWLANGTYEKSLGPRDYTFTYAHCTFIQTYDCLPKGHFPEDHKGDFTPERWAWLEQQLKSAQDAGSTHTFVAMHIPPAAPGAFDKWFSMYENTETRFFNLLTTYHASCALFGHLHQSIEWTHAGIPCYVTPSCCWNFATPSHKVDSSFVRLIKVDQDKISTALLPVHLDNETFTYETLPQFYNPDNHPK